MGRLIVAVRICGLIATTSAVFAEQSPELQPRSALCAGAPAEIQCIPLIGPESGDGLYPNDDHPDCPPTHLEFLHKCKYMYGDQDTINRSVDVYDEGVSFGYSRDSFPMPLVNILAAERKEALAIRPLLKKLEPFVGPIDRYNIKIEDIEFPEGRGGRFFISFVQTIAGYRAGRGDVWGDSVIRGRATNYFSGFLVEPDLPQLQPSNWISLAQAQSVAVNAVNLEMSKGRAYSFSKLAERNQLRARVYIDIDRRPDGMDIAPKYRLTGQKVGVEVNLYDSSVETWERHPIH